ncbi:MAG: multicopper oxidase family protein [Candidatus Altimarinota bacterium]
MMDHSMMDHSMMSHGNNAGGSKAFSTDPSGLPEAKPSAIVELNDGDEYTLTAAPVSKNIDGKIIRMLAYNGSIPGPVLKVRQGSTIKVLFKNEVDHPTSLHSHGVRLKNAFDGTHLVQDPVQPGSSFEYEITFPDPGMYWYHPHLREDYAQEMGMYGNYWVVPADEKYWSTVDREVPLFVDDLLLDEAGAVAFSPETADHALMGRFGNTMLVNGMTDYRLEVEEGDVVRFFITNSANTRPFRLSIPDVEMKLVGGDGGAYEQEFSVESIIIAPSERVVFEASFPKAGRYHLMNETPLSQSRLGTIEVVDRDSSSTSVSDFSTLRKNSFLSDELSVFRSSLESKPDRLLNMDVDMAGMSMGHMMTHSDEKIEWEDTMPMMNIMSTPENTTWKLTDPQTGKSNMSIDDWKFKVGEKVKIRLFNDPNGGHPMQHPIHIHGQRFLVVSINGKTQENLVWKDTVLVQTGDTVDLIVEMSNPGKWMIHCHIAEHLESSMMMQFEVL